MKKSLSFKGKVILPTAKELKMGIKNKFAGALHAIRPEHFAERKIFKNFAH